MILPALIKVIVRDFCEGIQCWSVSIRSLLNRYQFGKLALFFFSSRVMITSSLNRFIFLSLMVTRILPLVVLFLLSSFLWAERVTIYRDQYGVPHIFAETDQGVAFGTGYAQAEDRLEQLLRNYRKAEGTLAEALGGQENFRSDYMQRVFRHAEVSQRGYRELSARTRVVIEAFQEGVRFFMREYPDQVPDWAPKLHPWQVVALARFVIWSWPFGEVSADLRRGGIELTSRPYLGSNEWLVAPQRTTIGAPIALIDPHLSWYDHFRFYECRLYGGEIQFSGVTVVGIPFPALGHSRYVSIAMTTGGPDTSDIYEEEINPSNSRQYRYDGAWREITVRTEKIGMKEGDGVRWLEVEIESTHHGPVLARKGDKAYAMAVPYANEVKLTDQIYRMVTARTLDQIKKALGMLQLMAQNVMVGTVHGDIYYLRNGRVPIRPKGFDFSRPVPGNTSASEWQGIHPLSDLIQITNPAQEYMQNCNISPALIMKSSPLVRDTVRERPYLYNGDDDLHQRAAMVLQLLHDDDQISVDQALEIAVSSRVYQAESWQALLENVGAPPESDLTTFYERIIGWNRRMDTDSLGAIAYKYWKDSLGATLARVVDAGQVTKGTLTSEQLLKALGDGRDRLHSHFGSLEVNYGRVFRLGRKGADEHYPVGGGSLLASGMATPRAIGFEERPDHTFLGYGGQAFTQVVILARPPYSFTVVPLGQSDHSDSPHWDDQSRQLFSKSQFKSSYFLDRVELMKHVKTVRELTWPVARKKNERSRSQDSDFSTPQTFR